MIIRSLHTFLFILTCNHCCFSDVIKNYKIYETYNVFNNDVIEFEDYEIEVQQRLLDALDFDDKIVEGIITLYPEILYKNYDQGDGFLSDIILKILDTKNIGFIRKAIEIYPHFIHSVFGSELLLTAEAHYFDSAYEIVSCTLKRLPSYNDTMVTKICEIIHDGIGGERFDKIHHGIRLLISSDVCNDIYVINAMANNFLEAWKKNLVNRFDDISNIFNFCLATHIREKIKKKFEDNLEIGIYLLDVFKGFLQVKCDVLNASANDNIILKKENLGQIFDYFIEIAPPLREERIEQLLNSYVPQQLSKDDIECKALLFNEDFPQLESIN